MEDHRDPRTELTETESEDLLAASKVHQHGDAARYLEEMKRLSVESRVFSKYKQTLLSDDPLNSLRDAVKVRLETEEPGWILDELGELGAELFENGHFELEIIVSEVMDAIEGYCSPTALLTKDS